MRYLIKFSYDGTDFVGFQRQPGKRTIQGELEAALTKINNNQKVTITATGRTDKKVHALIQYAHTDIDVNITENKLRRAMNSFLPDDIHVISTSIVDKNFNARYMVKEKTYKYLINLGEYNPIERNYIFQYNHELDIDNMKECAKVFIGEHDFRAFVTENKEKLNCIRNISNVEINLRDEILEIKFTGNGFLKYQVRNMVGVLIRCGEGKITKSDVKEILNSKARDKSGKTAPPEGLYLVDIKY